jgi:DNA-binding CsgD family transcriptional regulator
MDMGASMERLVDAIYESALDETRWSDVAFGMSQAFGGRPLIIFDRNYAAQRTSLAVAHNLPREMLDTFINRYSTVDTNPFLAPQYTAQQTNHKPFHKPAYIGRAAFERLPMFQDIYRPINVTARLAVVTDRWGGEFLGIAIKSRYGEDLPSTDEVEKLSLISRHIERAVGIGRALKGAVARFGAMQAALDAQPHTLLIADAEAQILWCNAAAEARFAAGGGLKRASGALRAATPPETSVLRTSLRSALATNAPHYLRLSGGVGGGPLILAMSPLPRTMAFTRGGVLIEARERASSARVAPEAVAIAFGLTPGEARAAAELCNGVDGVSEIAARLGVQPSTVKSLLQRAFAKTGARTQAQLALMIVSTLPDSGLQ